MPLRANGKVFLLERHSVVLELLPVFLRVCIAQLWALLGCPKSGHRRGHFAGFSRSFSARGCGNADDMSSSEDTSRWSGRVESLCTLLNRLLCPPSRDVFGFLQLCVLVGFELFAKTHRWFVCVSCATFSGVECDHRHEVRWRQGSPITASSSGPGSSPSEGRQRAEIQTCSCTPFKAVSESLRTAQRELELPNSVCNFVSTPRAS